MNGLKRAVVVGVMAAAMLCACGPEGASSMSRNDGFAPDAVAPVQADPALFERMVDEADGYPRDRRQGPPVCRDRRTGYPADCRVPRR